jgi:hypothetical protein
MESKILSTLLEHACAAAATTTSSIVTRMPLNRCPSSWSTWRKRKGYRDTRIVSDSVTFDKEKNGVSYKINVEEGNKYYFENIKLWEIQFTPIKV